MPIYEIDVGGKTHEIESEKDLSDEQIGQFAKSLAEPSAKPSGRPEIPGAQPGAVAPPKTPERKPLGTVSKATAPSDADTFAAAGETTAGVGQGFWRQAGRGAGAVVQMLEEPVRAITGTPTQNYGPKLTAAVDKAVGPVTSPMGEGLGQLALGGAAAKALPMAQAAGGALARTGQAAATGGVVGAVSEPVAGGADYPVEKSKQMAMGVALGGGVQAVSEGAGVAKEAAKRAYFGTPGAEQQRLWQRAKDVGFSVRPDQARADESRLLQSGFGTTEQLKNQTVSNTLASRATGQEARALTPTFFKDRHDELGAAYDRIYAPGTNLKIDASAVQGLEQFVNYQQHIGYPWANRESQTAADRIIAAYRQINTGAARNVKLNIDAHDVQLLRNELSASARSSSNNFDRYSIGQVVDQIDASVARNHPQLAAELQRLSPQYRSLVTLERAATKGIVDPQGNLSAADLGRMLRSSDNKYVQGDSTNPLQELGQLGESFGIRGMGQARVTSGKGVASSGMADEVPVTKAGAIRTGIQAAKAAVQPVTGRVHDRYIREYSPDGPPPASTMGSATAKGAVAGVVAGQAANVPMADYAETFWRKGKKNESSDH